jgi:hypothetical protein
VAIPGGSPQAHACQLIVKLQPISYLCLVNYLLVGLDPAQKAERIEKQVRTSMVKNLYRFSCFKFFVNGYCPDDPRNQDVATVNSKVFVPTKARSLVVKDSMEVPVQPMVSRKLSFNRVENGIRQPAGKKFYEYWAALLSRKRRSMIKSNSCGNSRPLMYLLHLRWSYTALVSGLVRQKDPVNLSTFGPPTHCALGLVVLGRPGDKAWVANIGLFVHGKR